MDIHEHFRRWDSPVYLSKKCNHYFGEHKTQFIGGQIRIQDRLCSVQNLVLCVVPHMHHEQRGRILVVVPATLGCGFKTVYRSIQGRQVGSISPVNSAEKITEWGHFYVLARARNNLQLIIFPNNSSSSNCHLNLSLRSMNFFYKLSKPNVE